MNRTVLSLRPEAPYGTNLAEMNRDLDAMVKFAKRLFDRATSDPVVTQPQMDILEATYRRLLAAQQEIDELWLISKEHFTEDRYSDRSEALRSIKSF